MVTSNKSYLCTEEQQMFDNKPQTQNALWFVIKTNPRAELKVAQRLIDLGIKVYCPTCVQVRQWSDRKKKIRTPLLPSMLLVNLPEAQRHRVFEASGVTHYLFWLGKPAIVRDQEVETLKNHLEKGDVVSAEYHAYQPGDQMSLPQLNNAKATVEKTNGKEIWVRLKEMNASLRLTLAP